MENWLTYLNNWLKEHVNKRLFILLTLPIVLSSLKKSEYWGFYAHKTINELAVFTLPNELFGFYKTHIKYIRNHAIDPDQRRYIDPKEACKHFMDFEFYYPNKSDIRAFSYEDAMNCYTIDSIEKHGALPWNLNLMKLKLQHAFEQKNIQSILKLSAEIGHYIGDAHVPLHTTKNYNGQLTNQKGIHGLWESLLVEKYSPEFKHWTGKASYVSNVSNFVWNIVFKSNLLVDSVLKMDLEVKRTLAEIEWYQIDYKNGIALSNYSTKYCSLYKTYLNGMIERQLNSSIHSIGSIWLTAWVDAGQPDLEALKKITIEENQLEIQHRMDSIKATRELHSCD